MPVGILDAAPLRIWAGPELPPLALRVGCASGAVCGKSNEDFFGVARSDGAREHGIVLAIADGISPNGSGRLAAELSVRTLLHDFYSIPSNCSASLALHRLLQAANDWLAAENRGRPALGGAVAALSVMVLRSNRYYLAHVGDTRVYRRRGAVFKQLTADHTWPRRDMRHVLKRAIGLDSHLVADFADGELRAGDSFLLVSDGVWDVLGEARLEAVLREQVDPQLGADRLVQEALAHQAAYIGRNDATAVIAAVSDAGRSQ